MRGLDRIGSMQWCCAMQEKGLGLATISDVARAAGVSEAAVFHVNETRPVRPDTRRKVLAAVDGLAYRRDSCGAGQQLLGRAAA